MKNDSLGDRMKGYENVTRTYLTRRCPCVLRLDGKAFHSFTKGFQRPFDDVLVNAMHSTAMYLTENVQGCKLAYVQSDEISLLLTDYDELTTNAWFDKNIQKMVSISASMATLAFNKAFREEVGKFKDWCISQSTTDPSTIYWGKVYEDFPVLKTYEARIDTAMFDSRVFVLPKEEVCNAFIWRQQDCTRNAIQMVAQANFSHKELQGKSCNVLQELLWAERGINFNDIPTYYKRGACVTRKPVVIESGATRNKCFLDKEIPIFTQDRNYIEEHVNPTPTHSSPRCMFGETSNMCTYAVCGAIPPCKCRKEDK